MSTILVTGIGGVVGQGIVRNLRALSPSFVIVGTNSERVSAGNHLCDHVYEVPLAREPGYLDAMCALLQGHGVDLIIPSTDYEVHELSLHRSRLSAVLAASPAQVTGFCLDKYLNYREFAQRGLPFAASILPSAYAGDFARTIVKPREGRGSRNIFVAPPDPRAFGDDYVVQEYLDGPELTTAFYVLQDGELHGCITMLRQLDHGNTSQCEVVRDHDAAIESLVGRIVAAFPFRGSCNLQTRVTKDGPVPFEINCRLSGTNSVRAQFGFPDVAYTVQELLLGERPQKPVIRHGCALRTIVDVIYPERALTEINDRRDDFYVF